MKTSKTYRSSKKDNLRTNQWVNVPKHKNRSQKVKFEVLYVL